MISDCKECREQRHDECKTVNCICQHKRTEKLSDGTVAPEGVRRDVR
jgi:hypothetical protein